MRIGGVYFFTDRGPDAVEFARRMEALGFDSLFLPEHTHIPASRRTSYPDAYGGGELPWFYARMLDQVVTLSAVASATSRLQLGTGVTLLAQHDAIAKAKELATLDHLSRGRLIFGVGMGWNRDEAEAHGVNWRRRVTTLREKVALMRALWSDDEASYDGELVRLAPSWQWPKPVQPGGPPVWVGGAGPTTFREAARWADGIYIVPPPDDPGLDATLLTLREVMFTEGRDPSTLTISVASAPAELDALEHFQGHGVSHVVIDLDATVPDQAEANLEVAGEVVRRFRERHAAS